MNIRKNKLEKSERRFAGKGLNNSWVGSPGTLGLKKFGPGKLRVKKVWAQNICIDSLAELDNFKKINPPPNQFQEILPSPKIQK